MLFFFVFRFLFFVLVVVVVFFFSNLYNFFRGFQFLSRHQSPGYCSMTGALGLVRKIVQSQLGICVTPLLFRSSTSSGSFIRSVTVCVGCVVVVIAAAAAAAVVVAVAAPIVVVVVFPSARDSLWFCCFVPSLCFSFIPPPPPPLHPILFKIS